MILLSIPWLEVSIILAALGALVVSRLRNPSRAFAWGLGFTAGVFACTLPAWLEHYLDLPASSQRCSIQEVLFGATYFRLDELSAPLVPAVALLHFLTALATARTKMRRFSLSWSLTSEAIRLATFSCTEPCLLIGLLIACAVPPFVELRNRGKSTAVYALHMGLFVGLLLIGWVAVEASGNSGTAPAWAAIPLMAAILIRCGAIPAHCWLTDWFENASFGNALLYVAPLTGVYAALRLVIPIAPDWVLLGIVAFSQATAVYAAGMAIFQVEARRFFAYLFLGHASLVLVGLELHTPLSLTGALCLWFSLILSLGGFGLTLRALEGRFGRLSLARYRGLYDHSPALAVCFLLTGLGSVGFPGTLGFISTELLVDGTITANPLVGLVMVLAAALNGIAVLRAYFLLFTGARHTSTVSLEMGLRERIAVLTLAALVLGGGLFPQPGVVTRHKAAEEILEQRQRRQPREVSAAALNASSVR